MRKEDGRKEERSKRNEIKGKGRRKRRKEEGRKEERMKEDQ